MPQPSVKTCSLKQFFSHALSMNCDEYTFDPVRFKIIFKD